MSRRPSIRPSHSAVVLRWVFVLSAADALARPAFGHPPALIAVVELVGPVTDPRRAHFPSARSHWRICVARCMS